MGSEMTRDRGFAVDISNWSGQIGSTTVEQWKLNGVKRVIVGTQNEAIMRQQMHQVTRADVSLEAYVYLYDNFNSFADQVKEAIRRFADFPVRRLWLDCEFATTAPPDVVVERIQRAVDACNVAGVTCGIYTGGWWWRPMTGNYVGFADVPLWFASYVTPGMGPNCPAGLRPGFGGWQWGVMRQYRGTVLLNGVNVDFNWFDEEVEVEDGRDAYIRALEAEVTQVRAELASANNHYAALYNKNVDLRRCAVAYARRIRVLEEGMRVLLAGSTYLIDDEPEG